MFLHFEKLLWYLSLARTLGLPGVQYEGNLFNPVTYTPWDSGSFALGRHIRDRCLRCVSRFCAQAHLKGCPDSSPFPGHWYGLITAININWCCFVLSFIRCPAARYWSQVCAQVTFLFISRGGCLVRDSQPLPPKKISMESKGGSIQGLPGEKMQSKRDRDEGSIFSMSVGRHLTQRH